MNRYFIHLSYLGTRYCGWQIQPNANTIQAELEKSLSTILRQAISTTGAGRTDTGVHASTFVAHFDSDSENLHLDNDFLYKLNAILPQDIAVQSITSVSCDAHARFSALSRTYDYRISIKKDPFDIDTSWYFKGILDINRMNEASMRLLTYRDFTSFSKKGSDVKTNNCKVYLAQWSLRHDKLIFTIKADRFLRNMVRAIVGTLVDVGRGSLSPDDFARIIELRDRSSAGTSAPASGLFLTDIEYPDTIFNQ